MNGKPFEGMGAHATARWMAAAYDVGRRVHATWRMRQRTDLHVPVISLGNLLVGGAGKTPLTIALARHLAALGRVAVLSRGYGGREKGPCRVTGDADPQRFGDEAVETAAAAEGVDVWVARDRVAGARFAVAGGARVILLDDGFAYRSLLREIDLLVFDERGVGNGLLLPAGPLREPLSEMTRAHGVLLRGKAEAPREWTGPVFRFSVLPRRWTDLAGRPVDMPAKAVAAAGIAWPARFFACLGNAGVDVVATWPLPDHAHWKPSLAAGIREQAAGLPVVVTAKDAVKIRHARLPGNWVVAHAAAEIEEPFWPWLRSFLLASSKAPWLSADSAPEGS